MITKQDLYDLESRLTFLSSDDERYFVMEEVENWLRIKGIEIKEIV